MAQIICRDLSFAYDGETVLSDINFSLDAGAYLCIVGENGSGKSTLMRGLLGLKTPSTGTITFNDLKPTEIGYLPQQTQIQRDFPASVREVVLSGRLNSMHGRLFYNAADKAAAAENMERLGIDDIADRCYLELSGGQQQRVFLARALAQEASVYLLDEPFKGVDMQTEKIIVRILKEMESRGKTILVVHHALRTVPLYFDHVAMINRRLIAAGSVRDVFTEENIEKTFSPSKGV